MVLNSVISLILLTCIQPPYNAWLNVKLQLLRIIELGGVTLTVNAYILPLIELGGVELGGVTLAVHAYILPPCCVT